MERPSERVTTRVSSDSVCLARDTAELMGKCKILAKTTAPKTSRQLIQLLQATVSHLIQLLQTKVLQLIQLLKKSVTTTPVFPSNLTQFQCPLELFKDPRSLISSLKISLDIFFHHMRAFNKSITIIIRRTVSYLIIHTHTVLINRIIKDNILALK